jgi:short-subunit dehydrogenase
VSARSRLLPRFGPLALVAGAAEGLGAALARELAASGFDLVLVDVEGDGLRTLASDLARLHHVSVRPVELDLASPGAAQRLAAEAAGRVSLLVVNAAFAPVGPFDQLSPADAARTIDVNVRAPTELCAALVPPMMARGRGGVLLIGSNAGLVGHTQTAVYGATKAYLVRLGEALSQELAPSGVRVVVACPGAVRTPGFVRSGAKVPGALVAPPERVAKQALAALDGDAPVVVTGSLNRATMFALRALPRRLAVGFMDRVMRTTYPPARGELPKREDGAR